MGEVMTLITIRNQFSTIDNFKDGASPKHNYDLLHAMQIINTAITGFAYFLSNLLEGLLVPLIAKVKILIIYDKSRFLSLIIDFQHFK